MSAATDSPHTPRPARVELIDLGRGVAVLLMIMVHTMWLYADVDTQSSSLIGVALHFIGKGTAGFLIAMGFSFMLARDQSVGGSLRRGLFVLGVGYAMNFLKFVVPCTLGFVPDAFIEAYGWTPPPTNAQLLYMVMTGDILQLAGVCLLLMGVIRALSPRPYMLLIWALVFACGTHLVRGAHVGLAGVDYVLDLLWGVEWNVYFPVFPWFAAILVGMFLGARYRERDDQDRLFLDFLFTGLPMTLVGFALIFAWPETHFVDFFHLGFGGILNAIGLVLVVGWVIHRVANLRAQPGPLRALILYSSAHVTALYVVSWVLICWGMGLVGYQTLGPAQVLAALPVTMGLSFAVVWGIQRLTGAKP